MQSVGRKKNKTHRKTLQCYNYKSAQHEWSQLQNLLKSRVGILLLKFHLNGSSGSLAPTDEKGENTIFYIHQKPTQLKIYITKEKINK